MPSGGSNCSTERSRSSRLASCHRISSCADAVRTRPEDRISDASHERETLDRRINAVQHTLAMRHQGRQPRMDVMLEGFNDRYEANDVARWGRDAFEASNQWWHRKSLHQQREWKARAEALLARWREIQEEGHDANSEAAQAHASVHVQWFKEIPGTPTHAGDTAKSVDMIRGLATIGSVCEERRRLSTLRSCRSGVQIHTPTRIHPEAPFAGPHTRRDAQSGEIRSSEPKDTAPAQLLHEDQQSRGRIIFTERDRHSISGSPPEGDERTRFGWSVPRSSNMP